MRSLLFEVGALPYAFLTSQATWRAHGGELARLADLAPGDFALDLGCGPGESSFGMADRVPQLRVTGLDRSAPMVRFARLRQRFEPSRDRVTFLEGDATKLPFEAGVFDAVTGHSFLYLLPDPVAVLREAHRVLKPGGRVVFLEPASERRGVRLPPDIARRALKEPRFVTSMALWRFVSRNYGRFDRERFEQLFREAGLAPPTTRRTLSGLGLFGVAEKPR
jgi:ubiquinone/menaquinone biosynthesis C-methylase UbiE